MSSKQFKEGGDFMTWKCSKLSTTPVLKVTELGQEIKHLVKEGKITVHSVMSIWTGSPFGAVEAFKMSDKEENEIETKFSMGIHDIIDILQNLQREDTLAFWNDGPKDQALKNLFSLAQDTAQLNKKLERLTFTLSNYVRQLEQTVDIFKKSFPKNDEIQGTVMKPPKSGNCFKIRKVMRNAWYTLSRIERKSDDQEVKSQEEEIKKEEPEKPVQQLPAPVIYHPEVLTLERNKSESARVNCRNCTYGGHHCGHDHSTYQNRRIRIVPAPITIEKMQVQQQQELEQRQQDQEKRCCCQMNNCEEPHGVGDIPQSQDMPTDNNIANVHLIESQPFDTDHDQPHTSYLQEYEQVKNHRAEFDLNSQLILPVSGDSEKLPRTLGRHNKCSGKVDLDINEDGSKCGGEGVTKVDEITGDKNVTLDLSTNSKDNLTTDNNNDDQDNIDSKEVVVVRSAVSAFAESEFGVLDPEDLEWLNKIKEMGQTGQICADEIEQAEKLKRQSIFMNCIKYRVDEIHKDVTTVLNTLRQAERKWVSPLVRKPPKNSEDDNNLSTFELSQLVRIMSQFCQDLVANGGKMFGKSRGDGEKEIILEKLTSLTNEVIACHKSFKRFSKMIRADTNFIKDLCLSFPPITFDPDSTDSQNVGVPPCPGQKSNHTFSRPCTFEEIFC